MKQVVKNIIKLLTVRPYYFIRGLLPVWLFVNQSPRRMHAANPVSLSDVQKKIVRDLKQYGIALTHIEELFPKQDILSTLQKDAENLLVSARRSPKKDYFFDLWDQGQPLLTMNDPFVRLVLDDTVIQIANAYFEMYTRFYGLKGVQTTVMASGAKQTQSQLWHRDPDDKKLCKMFLYLNDVDEGTGPLHYVAESHPGAQFNEAFPQLLPFAPGSGRVSDDDVGRVIPKKNIKTCIGKAGTIIFADTAGLHKGGYSTQKSRLMFWATFMSPTPYTRPARRKKFEYGRGFEGIVKSLSPAVQYAVRKPKIEIF